MDQMISALAEQSLTEPLRKKSVSQQHALRNNSAAISQATIDELIESDTSTNNLASKKPDCKLIVLFTGQMVITLINSIPLLLFIQDLLANSEISATNQLIMSGSILLLPFFSSLIDSYLSIFSSLKKMNDLAKKKINQQLLTHSVNGFPVGLTTAASTKKPATCLSLLRMLGSFYLPICFAFTAATIVHIAADSLWLTVPIFSLSLVTSLLESQLNHSFFLLSHFIAQRSFNNSINPNRLQTSWIRAGCWLNEKRRWFNGLSNLCVLSIVIGIPKYLVESYDSWPNHLYWGGLMGLSASSCLAAVQKNYRLIQAQNRERTFSQPCAEKTRCFFFDRPELALLWQFATQLKTGFVLLFSFFSVLLLGLAICDQFLSSPSLLDYRVDMGVFALGTFLTIAVFHSLIHCCKPILSEQIGFSAWESLGLACSASSLLRCLAETTQFNNDSSAIKAASFLLIYGFSSLLITTRDTALHRVQTSNLFWKQPAARAKNRRQSQSDGILYSRSRNRLMSAIL
jgi:hypothetical protein